MTSVGDDLRRLQRQRRAAMTLAQRVELAFQLDERDLAPAVNRPGWS